MRMFDDLPDDLTVLGSEGKEAEAFADCVVGIIYGADTRKWS